MSVNQLLVPNNYDIFLEAITMDPVVIGTDAEAVGGNSCVAVGISASAGGSASTAVGAGANAAGNASVSLGWDSESLGAESVALGKFAIATGANSVAIGEASAAPAVGDISIGSKAGTTNDAGTGVIRIASVPNPVASSAAVSHSVPVTINGTVYYLKASTAP